MFNPNEQDLIEWYEVCEDLVDYAKQSKELLKHTHLVTREYLAVYKMRRWMLENDLCPIYYQKRFGWVLHYNWKERLLKCEELLG